MLYDPLDGVVKTSKTRQYIAALISKSIGSSIDDDNLKTLLYIFTVCLGAVAAGTALAWTSPVLPQISAPVVTNSTLVTPTNATGNDTSPISLPMPHDDQLQLTVTQRKFSL